MMQKEFINQILKVISTDESIIGLTVGGSWLQNEMDEYSDLDLILVTRTKITDTPDRMLAYASKFGHLLAAFTGDHVGERRLLICLYDNPLLHVDIKFLVADEFRSRVETPVILYDPQHILKNLFGETEARYPSPDYQWIEDRFWVWVHYAATKIGRGELFEALDMLSFLRSRVTGPLLQVQYGLPANGVRKLEIRIPSRDLEMLQHSVAAYNYNSIVNAFEATITLYSQLRAQLFSSEIELKSRAEEKAIAYFRLVGGRLADATRNN